ncbi:hypothetical protein MKX01_012190 [Papaver californicum]|nr:hypothetical protein MKX01_012190 [Papaver californicum]
MKEAMVKNSRFMRPNKLGDDESSPNFKFGEIQGVYPADETGARVDVSYFDCTTTFYKLVRHRNHHFLVTRNVNTNQDLGELPPSVCTVLQKISSFPFLDAGDDILDQLNVNEYPPGVGLSPHIDTHSAFEGLIFSLSLAGPCIMEFRRYPQGSWRPPSDSRVEDKKVYDNCSTFLRRSLFLPPRSMLLLSGEARYAWHHYIPHHKVDIVKGDTVRRGARRVSFTFRKVRNGPCCCEYEQYCDSQRSDN